MPVGRPVNAFATREDELFSNWEMFVPCLVLLAVSLLGGVLGVGLDLLFRK